MVLLLVKWNKTFSQLTVTKRQSEFLINSYLKNQVLISSIEFDRRYLQNGRHKRKSFIQLTNDLVLHKISCVIPATTSTLVQQQHQHHFLLVYHGKIHKYTLRLETVFVCC